MEILNLGGPYDMATEELRQRFNADGCLLIVFSGSHGTGVGLDMLADIVPHMPMLIQGITRDVEAALASQYNMVFCPICHAALDTDVTSGAVATCPGCGHFLKLDEIRRPSGGTSQQ